MQAIPMGANAIKKKIFFILVFESEEKYIPGINKNIYLYLLSVDLYSSVKIMSDGDHKELMYVNKMKVNRAMITLLEKNALIFRLPANSEETKMIKTRSFMTFHAPQ